jgi:transcriptional regulator with PAS, ATPase and Fis domain
MTPSAGTVIGNSSAISDLMDQVTRIARSNARVLITGESGVGKEIVAQAIYTMSSRANGPFVPVNCAGIPETLLESELFGHVKGSFTGAYRDKPGKLEVGSGGTIFLDEIGEMTLRMQALLLRYLETGEIQKVGADRVLATANVRIIAATNRNLCELVQQGQFREDLFYRLNVIHIVVPPLRERRKDIPLLVEHFLARSESVQDGRARSITREAMEILSEYTWPGNIRQLENLIERLIVTARHDVIEPDDLPPEVRSRRGLVDAPLKDRRRSVADDLFKRLVDGRESFWTAVYPLYMNREITKGNVRDLIHRGLGEARGNYKVVLRMFNMKDNDYKRFLSFLKKQDCRLPFKEYRGATLWNGPLTVNGGATAVRERTAQDTGAAGPISPA